MWTVLISTALIWTALAGAAAWHARAHWNAAASLTGLPIVMDLPEGMRATAAIRTRITTRLVADPKVVIPFDQVVHVRIDQPLDARARVDTTLLVDTVVNVKAVIPVNTEVAAEVPITSWLPRFKVMVPVVTSVPIDIAVPIRAEVPLKLDLVVGGQLKAALSIPVRTSLVWRLPIRATVTGEVTNLAALTIEPSRETFKIGIRQTRVDLPLKDIGWTLTSGAATAAAAAAAPASAKTEAGALIAKPYKETP